MNGKDKKRGTTKFGDQMKILIDSLANQDKSRAKCVRKLFRGVTRNSDPEDAEAVQLLLGRDHEWRIHQVKVMKAVSKIIRLMMITEGTTFSEMEWTELVELLISCRLFDVVNLLLRIKVRPGKKFTWRLGQICRQNALKSSPRKKKKMFALGETNI
nr:uncharacterized protein LOC129276038 [Lytechinus pictus]